MMAWLSPPKATLTSDTKTAPRGEPAWNYLGAEGACDVDGLIYFSTGKVGQKGEYHLGACFMAPPLLGGDDATYDKIKTSISTPLPPGSFVQIGLLAVPDAFEATTAYMRNKYASQGVVGRIARERAKLHTDGEVRPLVDRSGVLIRDFNVVVTVKIPCRQNPEDVEVKAAATATRHLEEGIRSAGLELTNLGASGYVELMRRIYHIYEPPKKGVDEIEPLREQIFYPGDHASFRRNIITFDDGDYFAKVMSVKRYPKRTSFGIANMLIGDPKGGPNQITNPFWMVLTLHYPDQTSKKGTVRTRYGWISQQCIGNTANLFPLLWYKKQGFDAMVSEMDSGGGGVVVEANLTLVVFGKTEESLERETSALQSYYSTIGFDMRVDKRVTRELWHMTLPLNTSAKGIDKLYRWKTMMSAHAAALSPLFGEWKGSGGNHTDLFATRRGQPATFSMWDSDSGFNGVLFGGTGGGKSFASQMIISDNLAEGAKVWTLDVGHSYYKLCRANNGTFMQFSEESDVCINPFTFVESIDDDMDILVAILAKMAAPGEGLDDFRLSALQEGIKASFTNFGQHTTVTRVAEWCCEHKDARIRDIGQQLYPFTRAGSNGRWFEGDNNVNFDNAFVVLELQALKSRPVLQKVVLLQLMSRIADEMYRTQGRRKLLVIDEAWELLDDPIMAKAVEAFYRKVRKHDGSVLIITQGIGDLYQSPNGRAIISNSTWKIIAEQKSDSIDMAVESKQFNVDPYCLSMVRSLHVVKGRYSDLMIMRSSSDWGVVRFIPEKFMNVLFSSSSGERDVVIAEIDAGVEAVVAVENYIHQQTFKEAA